MARNVPELILRDYDEDDFKRFWMDEELLKQVCTFGNPHELMTHFSANHVNDLTSFVDENDRVYGVMICFPLHSGVGHVWLVLGSEVRNDMRLAVQMARLCQGKMNYMVERWGLHRIQATVKADYQAGINFARHFGFEEEGLMKKWSPTGENYLMMSKTDFKEV